MKPTRKQQKKYSKLPYSSFGAVPPYKNTGLPCLSCVTSTSVANLNKMPLKTYLSPPILQQNDA